MGKLPLEGIRVTDLSVVWAGTFGTLLLADLGAEVIKVENPHVWQPYTRGQRARPTQEEVDAAGALVYSFPNGQPGDRPWNYHGTFVQLYRNKKSCTIDTRRPEGLELLRRLISLSDVVYENNAVTTWDKIGFTFEELQAIKDDVILTRVPAYGISGPYAHARALGIHLEGVLGHSLLRGYEDLDVSQSGWIFSADYMAGVNGALATMMALWEREASGQGQLIEVSQAEASAAIIAQAFMDYSLNERIQERIGNHSIFGHAPSGVYPCASPGSPETGDDRWISIVIKTDAQWQALCSAMGNPDWARDPDLEVEEGRTRRQNELDPRIREWTASQDDYELFHRLQALGVPAAPVLEASRLFDDPQILHREVYQSLNLFDDVGTYRYVTPFYNFSETAIGIRQPPVAMGEHNEYVYKDILGVSDEEYERYERRGHMSLDFDEAIP